MKLFSVTLSANEYYALTYLIDHETFYCDSALESSFYCDLEDKLYSYYDCKDLFHFNDVLLENDYRTFLIDFTYPELYILSSICLNCNFTFTALLSDFSTGSLALKLRNYIVDYID